MKVTLLTLFVLPLAAQAAGPQPTPALDYSTARGTWRGPAQFQFSSGGTRDPDAHQIAPMVIDIGTDGKVQGVIPDAGCKISGLAKQIATPTYADLDVSLKGCTDKRFNIRMFGRLTSSRASKEASLHLSAATRHVIGKAQQATITGVLRR